VFLLLQFVLYVWQLVSGLKVEQATALNGAKISYDEWLKISGICESICMLKLELFTCYFHLLVFLYITNCTPPHMLLKASKHFLVCSSDRISKIKASL